MDGSSVSNWKPEPGEPPHQDLDVRDRKDVAGNAGEGERQRDGGLPRAGRWCDWSGAVGCGVAVDLTEEGAELTDVGTVAKDQASHVAETEARLFL